MGNINNPIVTRSGVNVFWYHFWYSYKTYNTRVHKNKLVLNLIKIFLRYGLNLPKNIFFSKYWFRNYKTIYKPKHYFRWSVFINNLSGLESKHRLRLTSNLFYKSKTHLFIYNKWLIIITQWFDPDKRRAHRLKNMNQKSFQNFTLLQASKTLHLKRASIVRVFFSANFINPPLSYKF